MVAVARLTALGARVGAAKSLRRAAPVRAAPVRARVVASDGQAQVQLGTAKLPAENFDEETFVRSMFQWANTLTTSGQNLPFVLPQRVDPLPTGFCMAFLQSGEEPGTFVSVGEIVAQVEDVESGGRALMVRGTGKVAEKGVLVDVPAVMQTMPGAIKRSIVASTEGL